MEKPKRYPWDLGLAEPSVLATLQDDQLLSAHLLPDDPPLHTAHELFLHNTLRTDEACFASRTVTSGHEIIPMLSADVGIKLDSASAFGLKWAAT
jgi:hypothetical protein